MVFVFIHTYPSSIRRNCSELFFVRNTCLGLAINEEDIQEDKRIRRQSDCDLGLILRDNKFKRMVVKMNTRHITYTTIQIFERVSTRLQEQIEEGVDKEEINKTIKDLNLVLSATRRLFEKYYEAMDAVDKVYFSALETTGNPLASQIIRPTRPLVKDYHHSVIHSSHLQNIYD